jgi:translocation and assembly module TamB
MGRAALLLILLVSVYFTLLRPFLVSERILFRLEGLSLGVSPPSLKVKRAYLYLPLKDGVRFLGVQRFGLSYNRGIKVTLEEGIVMIVREEERPPRPPRFPIPEVLREGQLTLKNLYITYLGRGFRWVHVRNLRLKERKLKGEALVRANGRTFHLLVEEATLVPKGVVVGRARLLSEDLSLRIRGFLSERGKARFRLEGRAGPLEGREYLVEEVILSGEGELDYRVLEAHLKFSVGSVLINGRKEFKDLRGKAFVRLRFGEDLTFGGTLYGKDLLLSFKAFWMPRRRLDLTVQRFEVDDKLLGVGTVLRARVWGDVLMDLDRKRVILNLSSDDLLYGDRSFRRSHLFLDYNYEEKRGSLELTLLNPGSVNLRGTLEGRTFSGTAVVSDLPVVKGEVALLLSYRGGVAYREGNLDLAGRGSFSDLRWREVRLGGGDFTVVLTGGRFRADLKGEGFEGFLRGDLKGKVFSDIRLKNFEVTLKGVRVAVREGRVELVKEGGEAGLSLRVASGEVTAEDLRADLSGGLSLTLKGAEGEGSFSFEFANIVLGGKNLGGGRVKGDLKGDRVVGSFEIGSLYRGSFRASLKDYKLTAEGDLSYGNLSGRLELTADGKGVTFRLGGLYTLLGRKVPLNLEGRYGRDEVLLKAGPLREEFGVADLSFGGVEVEGRGGRGVIRFKGSRVRLLGEDLVVFKGSRGYLDLKEKVLRIDIPYEGGLEGVIGLRAGVDGFFLSSEGRADLGRISFLTATPLGGKAEGTLRYSVSLKEDFLRARLRTERDAVLYSRYLAMPMNLNLILEAEGRSLASFLSLWSEGRGLTANLGTGDLRNFYVYLISKDLPLTYRTDSLELDLEVSGTGWVEVRDLKEAKLHLDLELGGEVRVIGDGGKAPKVRGFPPLKLHVNFRSKKPLRIKLPEGYIYAQVRGKVEGTTEEPLYRVQIVMISGELRYFGRTFYLRSGRLTAFRTPQESGRTIDMDLVNPGEDMNIHISLRGDPSEPEVFLWSEPPRSVGEIVTRLLGGSSGEGAIPVSEAILRRVGYGRIGGDLLSALGLDVNLITKTGPQGELGVNLNIRKKISRFLSVEYQQSTLRDPRETFYGGGIRLPGRFSIFGRVFSDDTSELKLRFIRKFDF